MSSNQKTLAVYQDHFSKYIKGTAKITSGSQKDWIDSVLARLQPKASILEIGSAHGRDAQYIQKKGFTITPTDAFDSAVKHLTEQGFDTASKLNILENTIKNRYDLIIASAVFVHFNKKELTTALNNIRDGLKGNGLLAFTVKLGTGEAWTTHKMQNPRYFHYYSQPEVKELLRKSHFTVQEQYNTENAKWLHVVCEVKHHE